MSVPLACVVVPTHDHASTLDLAIRSALAQTVESLEVVIVGDGVRDDTRDIAAFFVHEDPRVRFLDLAKGPEDGAIHRGRAVESTEAEIVCYLCDDDLLLRTHVESMVGALAEADFAQCLNGYVDVAGSWHPYFGDLAVPDCRAWMMQPDRNFVSLTGTAHTVAAYRRLPHGWRTRPPGRWSDHYMWQQFLREPWVRAVTTPWVTALQFPSHLEGREQWSASERRQELEEWLEFLAADADGTAFDEGIRRCLVSAGAIEHVLRERIELHAAELAVRVAEPEARLTEV
jgi:GalNAc5-diNAcBac-PP-undecaprenol beta-1,3-glucosyltransferase